MANRVYKSRLEGEGAGVVPGCEGCFMWQGYVSVC